MGMFWKIHWPVDLSEHSPGDLPEHSLWESFFRSTGECSRTFTVGIFLKIPSGNVPEDSHWECSGRYPLGIFWNIPQGIFQKIPTGNVLEDPLVCASSRTFPQIFCGRGRGVPPVYLKKTPLASGRGRGCALGKGGGRSH